MGAVSSIIIAISLSRKAYLTYFVIRNSLLNIDDSYNNKNNLFSNIDSIDNRCSILCGFLIKNDNILRDLSSFPSYSNITAHATQEFVLENKTYYSNFYNPELLSTKNMLIPELIELFNYISNTNDLNNSNSLNILKKLNSDPKIKGLLLNIKLNPNYIKFRNDRFNINLKKVRLVSSLNNNNNTLKKFILEKRLNYIYKTFDDDLKIIRVKKFINNYINKKK